MLEHHGFALFLTTTMGRRNVPDVFEQASKVILSFAVLKFDACVAPAFRMENGVIRHHKQVSSALKICSQL